jgi:hypothetical protein
MLNLTAVMVPFMVKLMVFSRRTSFLVLTVILIIFFIPLVFGQSTGSKGSVKDRKPIGDEIPSDEVQPITEFIPFFGKRVKDMGFDLPLPFGISLVYTNIRQHSAVGNVRIGEDESPVDDVTIPDPLSKDNNMVLRGDMWLFPFMNMYGVVGYTKGEAEIDATITGLTVPIPNPFQPGQTIDLPIPDIEIQDQVNYEGLTYGGGTTLAAGYRFLFGTLDLNYTFTKLNLGNNTIKTFTAAPRGGILITTKEAGNGAVWVGSMYMDYNQSISGVADLSETLPSFGMLPYKLSLNGRHPWNVLLGGTWDFHKRWSVQAEFGFLHRKQLMISGMFRF